MNPSRRRGEAAFVATRTGFWQDPKVVLGVARELRVPPGLAGSFTLRWEEFVLEVGDAIAGSVKGYTAEHLCEAVGFSGRASRLVRALEHAGVLRVKRGTFLHPFWAETVTGQYAIRRAKDRDRHRPGKGEGEGGDGGKLPGVSVEDPRRIGDQASNESGSPPEAPPQGGRESADALWKWFSGTYPKMGDPRKTRRLLAQMTPEDEAQLRYCLPLQLPRYVSAKKTKGWRFIPFSTKYLEGGRFWEFTSIGAAVAPTPDELEQRRAQKQREAEAEANALERWQQLGKIRERLRAEGLRGDELERRCEAEFEALQAKGAAS